MNFIEKLRNHSFVEIWRYLCSRILHIEITKFHLLKKELDKEDLDNLMKGFDLDVKILTYEDFLVGETSVFNESKLRSCKERLESGTHISYGIIQNGKLVYSCWISLENLSLPVRSNYKLKSNEGFMEDAYCAPELRGKGIHSKMNNFRLLKLYEAGKSTVLGVVMDGNTTSMHVQAKSGMKEVRTFYICKLFGYVYITL